MIVEGAIQIGTSKEAERTRARFVYEEIRRYCEQRVFGIGGFYRQESYRLEFLTIYYRARQLRLTGFQARQRYGKRQGALKRKQLFFHDYVVSEASIREYLKANFLSQTDHPDHEKMVDDLCGWWDAWDYVLDRMPSDLRSGLPSTPQPEFSAAELEQFRQSPGFHLGAPKDRRPLPTDHPLWKNWPN